MYNYYKYFTAKLILCLLCLLLFSSFSLYAQTGSIKGIVKDKKNAETLAGVNVVLNGTTVGAATDFDGSYLISNLKPGTYTINVSFISYNTILINDIVVEANKTTNLNIDMDEATMDLETFTISAVGKTNTENSIITAVRQNSLVSNGISAQQITRSLDRDAGEVVKRIPGITIMQDRFIIVRGLSQRYNNVWLNNSATPSSEADVRAFSFDVIPSSMIDNILVLKTSAPELPGDFAGGFIKIFTKSMPDVNSFSIGYSSTISSGTSFNDLYKYNGSSTDILGYDNGLRSLPGDMKYHLNYYNYNEDPKIRSKLTDFGKAMNNNWIASPIIAIPDQRFNVNFSRKFNIKKVQVGTITAVNYSNSFRILDLENNNFSIYQFEADKASLNDAFRDIQYTNGVKTGIMHNWAFFLGRGHKIDFRNSFNQIGQTRTTIRNGIEYYNDQHVRAYEYRYQSRSILSSQIGGTHSFREGKTKADWTLGYSYANKKEPDQKRLKLLRSNDDSTKYLLLFGDNSNPDLAAESRMWVQLEENIYSSGINFTHKFSDQKNAFEIKSGLYVELKDRVFSARNFGYTKGGINSKFGTVTIPQDSINQYLNNVFADDNINLTTGVKLAEITDLSDSYLAGNKLYAGYLGGKLAVGNRIFIYSGVRIEKNVQNLESYKRASKQKVEVNRDTINFLPSINCTYNITTKNLLRLAYGGSVNRPEFRELAPFYFVDFELNAGIYGNPDIKQAYVHNFDLRYEIYPSEGEQISVGGFFKQFINPIEMVILGNNPTQYSFQNVQGAYCYGAEIDLKKNFSSITAIKYLSAVFNASYIFSEIQFADSFLYRDRPMQGQSPYIINTGLFYDNTKRGLSVNVLYNVIGERIMAVGRPSPNQWEDIPDIYEMPHHNIDLSISKKFGKHAEIKFGIRDVLNQKIILKQKIDTDVDMVADGIGVNDVDGNLADKHFTRDQIVRSFRPNRFFSLGFNWKF